MSGGWLRERRWTFWLLLACLLGGAAIWVNFARKLGLGGGAVALFGISLAWSAALAALLAAFGALVELALRRPSSVAETRFPALLLMLQGAGFAMAMAVPLVGRFSRGPLILAIAGLLLFAFGFWRRRLPYDRAVYPFLHLGLVVLAFAAPREAGQFFFRWAVESVQSSYRWSGGDACGGADSATQKIKSLKQVRPPYVIDASGLRGDLGRAVARRLGRSDRAPKSGVARLVLAGKLEMGSVGCYLPFFHVDGVESTLKVATVYRDGEGPLRCTASHALAASIKASFVGVAACRDLRSSVAAHLARELRAQAKRVTGHGK